MSYGWLFEPIGFLSLSLLGKRNPSSQGHPFTGEKKKSTTSLSQKNVKEKMKKKIN
jgi:hypothetical protein